MLSMFQEGVLDLLNRLNEKSDSTYSYIYTNLYATLSLALI